MHTFGNGLMRLIGAPQWVNFSIATLLNFTGFRFEQWNGFRYATLRCSFTFSAAMSLVGFGFRTVQGNRFSFAMHFVAAG